MEAHHIDALILGEELEGGNEGARQGGEQDRGGTVEAACAAKERGHARTGLRERDEYGEIQAVDALEFEDDALGQGFGGAACQGHDGFRAMGYLSVIQLPPLLLGGYSAASTPERGAASRVHCGLAIHMLVGLSFFMRTFLGDVARMLAYSREGIPEETDGATVPAALCGPSRRATRPWRWGSRPGRIAHPPRRRESVCQQPANREANAPVPKLGFADQHGITPTPH